MPEKLLITIPEVAELLRVESNTIRVWLSKGKVIPSSIIIRLGSRVFFNEEKFIKWVKEGCKMEVKEEQNGKN